MTTTNATTTNAPKLSDLHLAVLLACYTTNLRVTNTTDLDAALVHHSTCRALLNNGLCMVDDQPTVKRGTHLRYLVITPAGRAYVDALTAPASCVDALTAPAAQPVRDEHAPTAPTADDDAIELCNTITTTPHTTEATMTTNDNTPFTYAPFVADAFNVYHALITPTAPVAPNTPPVVVAPAPKAPAVKPTTPPVKADASEYHRDSTDYPKCKGCGAQCNPAFLNGGYCRKAGCEVKRRQTLVKGDGSASVKAVTPVKVPVNAMPPVAEVAPPAPVTPTAPVVVASEVVHTIAHNPPVAVERTPTSHLTPTPVDGLSIDGIKATLEGIIKCVKADESRKGRGIVAYMLLQAGVIAMRTLGDRLPNDNVKHVQAIIDGLSAFVNGTQSAPVPTSTPAPAPVATVTPHIDYTSLVNEAISKGTLGALGRACKAVGINADSRDGGAMKAALRQWLKGNNVNTIPPTAPAVPLRTVESPKANTPTTPKQTSKAHGNDGDKAKARAVGLSVAMYRVLKAIGDSGKCLTYNDIEALTGYYSILTAVCHPKHGDSLGGRGLVSLNEGSLDHPGKICFTITAKGREYLAKAAQG